MQIISEYSFAIIGVLGALAFMVSLITELLKDMPGIKKLPTKAFVILVSLVVTVAALLIYVAYAHAMLLWYYVALAVFAAFVVAYIAMYGWDTLKELKDRFVK
ncbi:ribonuclease [Petralouisia muris]|uniref:Ribonuclease n=1 Tax=Petralouisia muris TaxID=3032872 RepID=A0AC61RSW6_9FIRM|nr:ribonuclease [Petralouisia muris]TGY93456.1 ribonuclease [Petralouisia muris]